MGLKRNADYGVFAREGSTGRGVTGRVPRTSVLPLVNFSQSRFDPVVAVSNANRLQAAHCRIPSAVMEMT